MKRKVFIIVLICILFFSYSYYTNYKHQEIIKNNLKEINNLKQELEHLDISEPVCDNKNAINKLNIISAYGDNEAYHPKVLYFEKGWNGYKYWMAYSPYPKADDKKENPHIVASNDMIRWETPQGLKNPLDNVDETHVKNKIYNSDPHLVYNNELDQIECWWRYVDDVKDRVVIYRRTSKDGIEWESKEVIFDNKRSKKDYISPTVIYKDGKYNLWFIGDGYKLQYWESSNLKEWNNKRTININYQNKTLQTWHFDIVYTNGLYEAVLTSFNKGEKRNNMNLYYTKSYDNIDWESPKLIMTPSFDSNSWDNKGLYRGSLLHIEDKYYLFYSAFSWSEERGIGLVSGSKIDKLCYKKEPNT